MGGKLKIPVPISNDAKMLGLEKYLLEKHYHFLAAKIENGVLIATGFCKPSEFSIKYDYKVKFIPREMPKVYVLSPKIVYHNDIHMYKHDNSLCLFYPRDFSWTRESHLFDTIIPWTHEWFVFYELYLLTGEWLHPFVKHTKL